MSLKDACLDFFDRYGLIWEFPKIRGSYKRDYSILGSILGSPYFGKLPYLKQVFRNTVRLLLMAGADAGSKGLCGTPLGAAAEPFCNSRGLGFRV